MPWPSRPGRRGCGPRARPPHAWLEEPAGGRIIPGGAPTPREHSCPQHIEVQKLIKARPLDNTEFMQWFKAYFESVRGTGDADPEYDPVVRRSANPVSAAAVDASKPARSASVRPSVARSQVRASRASGSDFRDLTGRQGHIGLMSDTIAVPPTAVREAADAGARQRAVHIERVEPAAGAEDAVGGDEQEAGRRPRVSAPPLLHPAHQRTWPPQGTANCP